MGFLLCHPRRSSHTLFTAHVSRTHVKAPQTDLHIKPDNSSGFTHDNPKKSPLRTKVTFQPKQAPKSIKNTKPQENHPSQTRTNFSPCFPQTGNRDQGPKGVIGTKPSSTSMPGATEGLRKHQVRSRGSMTQPRSHRGSASIDQDSRPLGVGLVPITEHTRLPTGAVLNVVEGSSSRRVI